MPEVGEPDAPASDKQLRPALNTFVTISYGVGIAGWFAAWGYFGLFELVFQYPLMLVPLLGGPVVLGLNVIFWRHESEYGEYDTEFKRLQNLQQYSYFLVTAIIGTLVIAATVIEALDIESIPLDFLYFQSGALIFSMVGVLSLFWIPVDKPDWLNVLRHVKTIFFTYALFAFLGGLLLLVLWMERIM